MRKDLTGMRFGRLVVVAYAETKRKKAHWLCRCDCGNEKVICSDSLRGSMSRSCGCLRSEVTASKNYRHGFDKRGKRNRHYLVWLSMMTRCYTKTSRDFPLYGGRGIKVCDEWHDPKVFVEWCQSHEPIPKGYSVDRRLVNGDYSPDNCRFSSPITQSRNRRPPSEWRWQCWQE